MKDIPGKLRGKLGDRACSMGICVGAWSIGVAVVGETGERPVILHAQTNPHNGRPAETLSDLFSSISSLEHMKICATGRGFSRHLETMNIPEPEAVELACGYCLPDGHPYRLVISAGAETTLVYFLDNHGLVQDIHSGGRCASGSGEFYVQQLSRMSITLEEAAAMEIPENIHKLSGRCSVFCKSDCTHALNTGVPTSEVVGGLCRMMAGNILELLKKFPAGPVILTGGGSRNQGMVHFLKKELPDLFIPEEALWFEALGAGLHARGTQWNRQQRHEHPYKIPQHKRPRSRLKPISAFEHMVEFKHRPAADANSGDRVIVGMDVGSTTTKGVVMRRSDRAVLAAKYLRTLGDPAGAAMRVYAALASRIKVPVAVEGIGVTGSGRKIVGLHAGTRGIINEIVAHAAGAAHFDPEVDTIFEIGGQDAKYTSLSTGIPADYAMNEACSAGTGSFLEEACGESLGIDFRKIGSLAMRSSQPPDFSDQCAAFIASDVKQAVQDGISVEDITAGLVYSICRNYVNRVQGNRPAGPRLFMQGGTCYNRAVPVAMAAVTGRRIVVPPDPGLVGAFGVALEVDGRIRAGSLEAGRFDLQELAGRKFRREGSFRCRGHKGCDRRCEIARIRIKDRIYPFGGICSRYENHIPGTESDAAELDLVSWREQRLFRDLAPDDPADSRPTVGMNRSFMMHIWFPLYNAFFRELGFRLTLPGKPLRSGVERKGASFCYPGELAHGYAADLLEKDPDFMFMPLLKGIPSSSPKGAVSCTCVFVQGEPFYLRSAFPDLRRADVLCPTLDFSRGISANLPAFEQVADRMGVGGQKVRLALEAAIAEQQRFFSDIEERGKELLVSLRDSPDRPAVILFGRAYNSFTRTANKGIPAKFASRKVRIMPCDMLPAARAKADRRMYWGTGRMILNRARVTREHPGLYGAYITSFSCGPDSFILSYFRDIMAERPTLILELDSHTAHAGLDTRIEAFLDIVRHAPRAGRNGRLSDKNAGKGICPSVPDGAFSDKQTVFKPAEIKWQNKTPGVITSSSRWIPLTHQDVKVLIPPMSRYASPLLSRAFDRVGIRAECLPHPDPADLETGRRNSSCRECLPLQTTLGSLLNYLDGQRTKEVSVYLMATAKGPCRFGQYSVFMSRVIEKQRIPDVALLSPSSLNGYAALGSGFSMAAWQAIVTGDIFDEMWATILAGARNPTHGLEVLDQEFRTVLSAFGNGSANFYRQLESSAVRLGQIRLKMPYADIPKISLVGEIYVRHDPLSLQRLNERLAARGFIVRTATNSEWINYIDWLIMAGIEGSRSVNFWKTLWFKRQASRRIRDRLMPSGLFAGDHDHEVNPLIKAAGRYISPHMTCETILTVGSAMREILEPSCGIISLGPFGCMPSRVAEAILNSVFTTGEKRKAAGQACKKFGTLLEHDRRLPFLAIETDGTPFTQMVEARLEVFLLQASRLHRMMQKA